MSHRRARSDLITTKHADCSGTGRRHSIFDDCLCEPACEGFGVCLGCEGSGLEFPRRHLCGLCRNKVPYQEHGAISTPYTTVYFCHPDTGQDCYTLVTVEGERLANGRWYRNGRFVQHLQTEDNQ
jgi:hypothetical protein